MAPWFCLAKVHCPHFFVMTFLFAFPIKTLFSSSNHSIFSNKFQARLPGATRVTFWKS